MENLDSALSAAPRKKARRGQHRLVVVGVDGGGTTTDVAVLDAATQELLSQTSAGPTNWNSVGRELAASTLHAAVLGALTAARCTADGVVYVCLGLAGVDTVPDAERVEAAVRSWLPARAKVFGCNDAFMTLRCHCDESPGCALIAGTGSISVGVGADGGLVRTGGWGPMFLDSGSGYDLGQQALAAVARAADGRGESTALQARICAHCGVQLPDDLITWAYAQQGWAPIAALAPVVMAAARAGDAVASRIIATAADQAAGYVAATAARCELEGAFKIVLSGGLLEHPGSAFAEAVHAHLQRDYPHAELVVPRMPAHHAAALYAHRLYTQDQQ